MAQLLTEQHLIDEARAVLLLLQNGRQKKARGRIEAVVARLKGTPAARLDTDVLALWEQVEVAANNPLNLRYFEEVKDELNRVTFEYSKPDAKQRSRKRI